MTSWRSYPHTDAAEGLTNAAHYAASRWSLRLPLIRPIDSRRPPQIFVMNPAGAWNRVPAARRRLQLAAPSFSPNVDPSITSGW